MYNLRQSQPRSKTLASKMFIHDFLPVQFRKKKKKKEKKEKKLVYYWKRTFKSLHQYEFVNHILRSTKKEHLKKPNSPKLPTKKKNEKYSNDAYNYNHIFWSCPKKNKSPPQLHDLFSF